MANIPVKDASNTTVYIGTGGGTGTNIDPYTHPLAATIATAAKQDTTNTVLGTTADAVTGTSTGSISGKLRQIATYLSTFLSIKLFDNSGVAISSSNPLQVQQAQLTVANDAVQASSYLYNETAAGWSKKHEADKNANGIFTSVTTGSSNNMIAAPGASTKWRLHKCILSSTIAGELQLQDPSATIKYRVVVEANKSVDCPLPEGGWLSAAANNTLAVRNNTGSTADIRYTIFYNTEAA